MVCDPAECSAVLPIADDDAAAFRAHQPLGTRKPNCFEAVLTRLMSLRSYASSEDITTLEARFATGPPGLALAGRVSHPLDDYSEFHELPHGFIPFRPALPGRTVSGSVSDACNPHPRGDVPFTLASSVPDPRNTRPHPRRPREPSHDYRPRWPACTAPAGRRCSSTAEFHGTRARRSSGRRRGRVAVSEGSLSTLGTYHTPYHPFGLRPHPRRRALWSRAACAARALRDRRFLHFAN
jgi:hypothetical protein